MGKLIDFNLYKKLPKNEIAALEYINKLMINGMEFSSLKLIGKKLLTVGDAMKTIFGKKDLPK